MRMTLALLAAAAIALPTRAWSQTTATDGDWSAYHVMLVDTPQAEYMMRVGDIDNLGFGWPTGFDPFSGESTPNHGYPWTANPSDPDGTDRIMVVSSYQGAAPSGADGYTTSTSRPENNPRPIVLQYTPWNSIATNAALQIFVDDFQAPALGANYQVTLNGKRFTDLETIINSLEQTGPVGKLITVAIPAGLLPEIGSGQVALLFDDLTTGAGDGYAIDFVKLLVNLKGDLQSGSISGHVSEAGTDRALPGATVSAFNRTTQTDANGDYLLSGVPAGLAHVTAASAGYQPASANVDVVMGETASNVNLQLERAPLSLAIHPGVELEFFGHVGLTYVLQYSEDFQTWNDDEEILGTGNLVTRLRATRPPAYRFWRVEQKP